MQHNCTWAGTDMNSNSHSALKSIGGIWEIQCISASIYSQGCNVEKMAYPCYVSAPTHAPVWTVGKGKGYKCDKWIYLCQTIWKTIFSLPLHFTFDKVKWNNLTRPETMHNSSSTTNSLNADLPQLCVRQKGWSTLKSQKEGTSGVTEHLRTIPYKTTSVSRCSCMYVCMYIV